MDGIRTALVNIAGLTEARAGRLVAAYEECVDMNPEEPPAVRLWRAEIEEQQLARMVRKGIISKETAQLGD